MLTRVPQLLAKGGKLEREPPLGQVVCVDVSFREGDTTERSQTRPVTWGLQATAERPVAHSKGAVVRRGQAAPHGGGRAHRAALQGEMSVSEQ